MPLQPHVLASGSRPSALAGWTALVIVVALYAAVSIRWLGFFEWSIDEGMYLMRARMIAEGFRLYEDIWFNHPPLLVQAVSAAFAAFGERVETARMVALGLSCAGIVGVALVARELEGWRAGILAAVMLALSPLFFSLSRAVMSSLPALALATLAIGLALAARSPGRAFGVRPLVVASGLAFGLGAATKLIVAPLAAPVLVALAAADWRRKPAGLASRLVLWAAAAAAPLVAALAPYGAMNLWEQTVGSVVGARGAYELDVVRNLQDLLEWLADGQLGIAALGVYGIARGLSRSAEWRVVGVWLAAAVTSIVLQTPLWSHHFALLVLPLAVGAGAGVVWAAEDVGRAAAAWREPGGSSDAGWPAFGLVAGVTFLLALPVAVERNAQSTRSDSEDPWLALARLEELTEPGDYTVTDSPMHAFRAGLLVPPNLCDPGAKRFASRSLSLSDVADDIVRFKPTAVVTWNERFAKEESQALPAWLADMGYRLADEFDAGRARRIYLPPEMEIAPAARSVGARWAGGMELAALDVDESLARPGGRIRLRLDWLASGPTQRPLTVFAHLLDERGERIAQQDNPPGRGVRATDHWQPGETIRDVFEVDIPDGAVPGSYAVRIGVYHRPSGEAWPLETVAPNGAARADGDAIVVGGVRIEAADPR